MPKLRQTKRASEYLQLRPYRAIVAPRLRPQKERDQIAYGAKGQNRIRMAPKPAPSRARNVAFIVAMLLVVFAAAVWLARFRVR